MLNRRDLSRMLRNKNGLIRHATSAELKFASYLKELNIKYRFQKALGTNHFQAFRIVDFYIPKALIIFEIDGDYHNNISQEIRDFKRENEILSRRQKLIFVRFSNNEVFNQSAKVKQIIKEVYDNRINNKRHKKIKIPLSPEEKIKIEKLKDELIFSAIARLNETKNYSENSASRRYS